MSLLARHKPIMVFPVRFCDLALYVDAGAVSAQLAGFGARAT